MAVLSANPQQKDQVCCSHTSRFLTTWYLRAAQPGDFILTANMKGQWSSDSSVKYDVTNTTTVKVIQQVENANLTVSISQTIIPIQSGITVAGQLRGATQPTAITLYLTRPDNSTIPIGITTNSTGGYSYTFEPDKIGIWQAQAYWPGHGGSSVESFIVKMPTALSIVAFPSQAPYGATISVWGNLQNSANGTGVYNKPVTITYTTDNLTWTSLITVQTSSNGRYRHTWIPDAGTYLLRANFSGDFQATESSSSIVGLVVIKDTSILVLNPVPALLAGTPTNITGTLTDSRGFPLTGKSVQLTTSYDEGMSWTPLASVISDENGSLIFVNWMPQSNGTLRATWNGDQNYVGQTTNITITVTKLPTTTTIHLSVDQIEANNPVAITGQALDSGGEPLNGTINLQYSKDSGPWLNIGSTTTNSTGHYTYTWTPTAEGAYTIQASYQTNSEYATSTGKATLSVSMSLLAKIIDIFTKDRFLSALMTTAIIIIIVAIVAAVFLTRRKPSDKEPEQQSFSGRSSSVEHL